MVEFDDIYVVRGILEQHPTGMPFEELENHPFCKNAGRPWTTEYLKSLIERDELLHYNDAQHTVHYDAPKPEPVQEERVDIIPQLQNGVKVPSDAIALITILSQYGRAHGANWLPFSVIKSHTLAISNGIPWSRRTVAGIASKCGGRILSSGKGYMLDSFGKEEDILTAYYTTIKKSMGTDKRGRAIIANARRRGFLTGDSKIKQIHEQAQRELIEQTNDDYNAKEITDAIGEHAQIAQDDFFQD